MLNKMSYFKSLKNNLYIYYLALIQKYLNHNYFVIIIIFLSLFMKL